MPFKQTDTVKLEMVSTEDFKFRPWYPKIGDHVAFIDQFDWVSPEEEAVVIFVDENFVELLLLGKMHPAAYRQAVMISYDNESSNAIGAVTFRAAGKVYSDLEDFINKGIW